MSAAQLFIGLMSGTSLDGVDAVLVRFGESLDHSHQLLASHFTAFPQDLASELLALNSPGSDELRRAQEAGVQLAQRYADAVDTLLQKAGLPASAVSAIGCHGQTVRHRPEQGYSLQLNHPALLAERSGIAVIADFRNRDIAAGGQGAPLVPAFHQAILASPSENRVILNLGGIANITSLPAKGDVGGFDTGPANALLDGWIARHLGARFDADGAWAASGTPIPSLLARMLAHPFFAAPPPKSCGREEFALTWVDSLLCGTEQPQDVQATLAELTAQSAAAAILREGVSPQRLLLCGGGAHNLDLRRRLARQLPSSIVEPTDAHGVPGDWLEALAFAWLAQRCLQGLPSNLARVTGARGGRVLGAIYPA